MKKVALFVGIAFIVVVLAAGSIYYAGSIAENSFAKGQQLLAQFIKKSSLDLQITDRKYERGFFRSSETFKLRILKNKKEPALATDDTSDTEITVTSTIRHGPILGAHGIGAAWVDVTFGYPEETRNVLSQLFGDKVPLTAGARIGFDRSAHIVANSPVSQFNDDKISLQWGGAQLTLEVGRYAENVAFDLSIPLLEFSFPGKKKEAFHLGGSHLTLNSIHHTDTISFNLSVALLEVNDEEYSGVMSDATIDVNLKRFAPDRFSGYFYNVASKIGKFSQSDSGKNSVAFNNAYYSIEMPVNKNYVDIILKAGVSDLTTNPPAAELHGVSDYDFALGLRHLHAPSLAQMNDTFISGVANYLQNGEAVDTNAINQSAVTILKDHPVMTLDHLVLKTEKGPMEATATMTLDVPEDTPFDSITTFSMLMLFDRLHLMGKASFSPAAFDDIRSHSNISQEERPMLSGELVEKGFFVRDGDLIKTEFELKNSKFRLNNLEIT